MILKISNINPQKRYIKRAVEILENGGVIVYPTDTTYAYGCDVNRKKAIEKIYQIKNIKNIKNKPLSFIFYNIAQMNSYVRNISNNAFKIMKKALPGPYTLIFQASKLIPKIVLTKQKTIGVRIPDNLIALEIVKELGRPIVTTSVNTVEGEYVVNPEELEAIYKNRIDLILDAGIITPEISTIVDFSTGDINIVREGKGEIFF